jgi:NAD(P)-dependent dehydrogenase (short-subunit alcohol dehydrogenase family)
MSPVAVVTGANSGIGRATAIHLAGVGYDVYGTVRDRARTEKLQAMSAEHGVEIALVELDVADDESVRSGFAKVLADAGAVDVIVNNAGVGGNATVEDCTPEHYLDVMNVNLCGAVRCIQAVLPGMRERGSGAIVNLSSVAGRFGALAQAPYVASKWAMEGMSEELAIEVAPFGVRVVIVEPGVTKSAIFAKNVDLPESDVRHYQRMMQMYAAGIMQATDPFEVAKVIEHAVTTDAPELRYVVSWGAQELIEGRARMADADWVALGASSDDDEYYDRFRALFGLELRTD